MMLSIYLTVPEIDNDVRGINTRMGMRRSLKEGRWTGVAPIGYKNDRDHLKKPILIPSDKAPLILESFELFATGLYDKEELRRIMNKKGLTLGRSQFPKMLENTIYIGKISVPEFKGEDAQIVEGLHEPIVPEELFNKVQWMLKSNQRQRKLYEKLNNETPLRALITCSKCGGKLTSSASKGRSRYYTYYHCRNGCTERIPAEQAHEALLNYFDEVAVKPEVEKLYVEVMGTIFKANESNREQEIKKLKEDLVSANKKLASLEEKYVLNEIERDSYSFMKPRFKDEISKLREKLSDLESKETNYTRYLNSGISLLQNLSYYYEVASLLNKQKLIGSIFPKNLIIENGECRTARENEVILALKGFGSDFKTENPTAKSGFPILYPRQESNLHLQNRNLKFYPLKYGGKILNRHRQFQVLMPKKTPSVKISGCKNKGKVNSKKIALPKSIAVLKVLPPFQFLTPSVSVILDCYCFTQNENQAKAIGSILIT